MNFKKKTMLRSEWVGIEEKTHADMRVSNSWFTGCAGLLRMDRVDEPFSVNYFDRRVQITGKDYMWLQLAPENENYWATVMFDEKGELLECYFDITSENHVLEEGKSWFYDMILDVVIAPGSEILLLDANELDDALKQGEITEAQYEFAMHARERLLKKIQGREKAFFDMCRQLRKKLLEMLDA